MTSLKSLTVGLLLGSALSTVTTYAQAREQAANGAAAAAPNASAGDVAPARAGGRGSSNGTIEELVVTAERREERLQDVPISVTAMTGGALEKAGIQSTQQLTQAVPNLVMTHAGSSFQAVIRGVGTRGVTAGDEANTAIYVDGVYSPDQSAANVEFMNVKRVEVLRGPQGTLFGRNATGGLINIITADPSFTQSGEAYLSYGRFNERVARGYVTGPLSDKVAVDLAASYREDDGYVTNIFRHVKENPRISTAIRGKLLFQPTDKARLVFAASSSYDDDPTVVAYSPLNGNFNAKALFPGALIPGKYQVATNMPTKNPKHVAAASLQGSYNFTGVTLNTVTSFQDTRNRYINDNDGSQFTISYLDLRQFTRNWTQEIRLSSSSESRLQWVAGVFGFYSTGGYRPIIFCCTSTNGSGIPTASLRTTEHVKSIAGFVDGTYALTDKLSVTAGVRVSHEAREHQFLQVSATTGAVQGQGDLNSSFNDVSPRASVKYKFNDDLMGYFTYSRGFKSGVYNASSITQLTPVRPEKLDAFEVGVKADPTPRLRTNLSVFYYKYKDIQQSARDATANAVRLLNAANSTIKGAEFEATANATAELSLRFAATYLDAKYDRFTGAVVNFPLPQGGNSQSILNLSGTDMIRAPRYTLDLGFDYHHDLASGAAIALSGNVYRTAKYYWDFQNRLTVPAYTQVNGQLSYTLANGSTTVSVWGRNLTNVAVPQNLLPSTTIDDVTYEPPRTYGVSLQQKF